MSLGMVEEDLVSAASIDAFFTRSGLTPQDRIDCYQVVRQLYPAAKYISPASCQGYCSMTILVDGETVVQFRPFIYRLDLQVASAAKAIYGHLAPETKYITTISTSGLIVYGMERIPGISFTNIRAERVRPGQPCYCTPELCVDFARFLSKSWGHNKPIKASLGLVGSSLRHRVKLLCRELPARFQLIAWKILRNLHRVEALPWTLTHGDVVAGNILVDETTGRLTGFVDWAEAEWLPFGLCLYGLEELLGCLTSSGFQYHPDANKLRASFWMELKLQIPELAQKHTLEAVMLARDLGVLLWYGIAFDNGAIDRVVREHQDVDEIHKLDAFLDIGKFSLSEMNSRI